MNRFFTLSAAVMCAATMSAQTVEDYSCDMQMTGNQPHVIVADHPARKAKVGNVVLCDSVVYTVTENDYKSQKMVYTYNEQGDVTNTKSYGWNNETNDWLLSQVVEYTYDDLGNVVLRLEKFYEAETLSLTQKYAYAFDDNGNVLSLTVSKSTGDDQWEITEVQTNSYDENGNVASYIVTSYTNGTESKASKEEYTYNGKGLLVETILSNKQGSAWNKSSRTTITYNDQDLMASKITSNWMVVMWFDLTRTDYEYDADGNMLSYSYYVKGGSWNFVYRFTYTYDENGNRTQYVATRLNGNEEQDYSMCEYEYDENGNNTKSVVSDLNNDGEFEPYTCTESSFGEWGITKRVVSNWNNGEWVKQSTYTYYYGDSNPTSVETITITRPESNIYYNIQGQRLNNPVKGQIVITNGKKVLIK